MVERKGLTRKSTADARVDATQWLAPSVSHPKFHPVHFIPGRAMLAARRCFARGLRSGAKQVVEHDTHSSAFVLGDAILKYRPVLGTGVIDASSTVVPERHRGNGVGEQLCEALFAHARGANLKILPSCSYIRDRYVPRHAESVGDLALQSLDAGTPGLQIEVAYTGVATLRLSDARRRNPLHEALLLRLRDWLGDLAADWPEHESSATSSQSATSLPRVGCVVIEACGPIFSSGHDIRDFVGADRIQVRSLLDLCTQVNLLLSAIPQISVAAVAGGCLAAGAQLATSCDLLIAQRKNASFTLTGVHGRGFCHTPLVGYTGRLSAHKALELAVLGETIDAEEAVRIGLANRVVGASEWRNEVDSVSRRLAAGFNRNSADGKATLYRQAATADPVARYEVASDAMVDMFMSPNWRNHMTRFLERKSTRE